MTIEATKEKLSKGIITSHEADDFLFSYGFRVVEDQDGHYELQHDEEGSNYVNVIADCSAENSDDAEFKLIRPAIEYAEENNLNVGQIVPEPEIGTDEYIITELAKFLRDETLDECPISIVTREDIEGEEAELVRFTFGEGKDSCVAVVYSDGTVYTPIDWETPEWDDPDWEISDTEHWMDCNFRRCIMFMGLPRIL